MSVSSQEPPRHRTASRMRFVAPPGMEVDDGQHEKIIGRYEIIKTIGKGAMGVVYKARDPLLDRIVAVKTIVSPRGVGRRVRDAYIERFEREAKAAAKMQHPAIVTIFDVGVHPTGAPFMVLEYLPGESLADRLDRVRMPLGKGVQIGLDLGNALAFAHRQRIVHRDVKPANVLHAGENRWKLADFGIARLPDSDLTQVGIFMGTPGYSPPEAIRQGRYTPQADVFAWGAVLYEVLSGRIPYEGPDTRTTNGFVIKATAPSPREYDPSIPEPISNVIMTALNPSASHRYKDAAAAEKALREAWEYCLTSSMIAPSSLTGEEVPHERAGAEMHRTMAPQPSTSLPAPIPTAMAHAVAAAKVEAEVLSAASDIDSPLLIIESKSGRVSDDDPTKLLVRESSKGDATMDVGFGSDPGDDDDDAQAAAHAAASSALSELMDEAEAMFADQDLGDIGGDTKVDRVSPASGDVVRTGTQSVSEPNAGSNWIWALIVLLALAGGGALAYVLLGM